MPDVSLLSGISGLSLDSPFLSPLLFFICLVLLLFLSSIQFNSIKKTLIIPQGAILLWSWRVRKITIQKVKRTIQQTQHHQQKSLNLTIVIVINIEQL